jgi:hypothetical protein
LDCKVGQRITTVSSPPFNFLISRRKLIISIDAWNGGNQWTAVELNTGFICACIPVLKGPFMATLRFIGIKTSGYGSSSKRKSYPLNTIGQSKRQSRLMNLVKKDDPARASSEEYIISHQEQHLKSEWQTGGITKTTTIGVAYDAESRTSDGGEIVEHHIGRAA